MDIDVSNKSLCTIQTKPVLIENLGKEQNKNSSKKRIKLTILKQIIFIGVN